MSDAFVLLSVWHRSRNVGNGILRSGLRILIAVWLMATKANWLGVKAIPQLGLGSIVIYRDDRWMVTNMVHEETMSLKNANTGEYVAYAPKTECQPVKSLRECWHRFQSRRRWWTTNWLAIEVERTW